MASHKTVPKVHTPTPKVQHNNAAAPLQQVHFEDNRPETAVQLKLQEMADTYTAGKTVIQQKRNTTGLPDVLKSGIEQLSGYAMDDVKVHYNSDKPAQLQAHAYAQGTQIHLATGQEKHLAHEAWHVVQQKQGRVQPTTQLKEKVNINDDTSLEKEADVMGAKALQLQPSSKTALQSATTISDDLNPIQRVITINGGEEEITYPISISAEQTYTDYVEDNWEIELEEDEGEPLLMRILNEYDANGRTFEDTDALVEAINKDLPKFRDHDDSDSGGEGGVDDGIVDDTEATTATDSSITVVEEVVSEEPALEPISLSDFRKSFKIQSKASSLIKMVGAPKVITPEPIASSGDIAYVANILTVPGRTSPQDIINAYAKDGVSPENYGNFAMVIGVNMYRSLNGESIDKITTMVSGASEAPFPCVVVPIMWDFMWGPLHTEVAAAYSRLSSGDKATILQDEKKNLDQTHIPYGSLRESITAHPATREFVARFSESHASVYVHLGDDDASSLSPAMRGKPLLDSYTDSITERGEGHPPHLVVGGYSLSNRSAGGDLDDDDPEAQLTVIASALDTWFRSVLSTITPDAVYPTEPNMAFLAAHGKENHLETMLTPSKNDAKRLAKIGVDAMRQEDISPDDSTYLGTGLLYGSGANEGGKLRKNMREQLLGKKDTTPMTHYDSSLAIATDSGRFTMKDEDHIDHDLSLIHI